MQTFEIADSVQRIWEEKAIGDMYELYAPNVRVFREDGLAYGRDDAIADTTQRLAAFPDLRLHTDELVQSGAWTSHRFTLTGTNTGWSEWGPPTGRRIAVGAIAERRLRHGQVREEHVIHNTASVVRQLGHDPRALARRTPAAASEPGQVAERRAADDGEAFVRDTLDEVFNQRRLDRIATSYAPGLRFHGSADRELYGRAAYTAYVLELLAMFPDATYRIDDLYWMGETVAVRWTLDGTHRGYGPYGPPTGRRVRQWGLTHVTVRDGTILEEWTYSNEFHVLQQIYGQEVT